jgi:chromosomal replication initiation ATPase DnaA
MKFESSPKIKLKNKVEAESIKVLIEQEMEIDNIFKKTRRREYVDARRMLFYILRNNFLLTYFEIGRISKRDHATIIHAIKDFDYIIKADPILNGVYEKALEKAEFITTYSPEARKEEIIKKIEQLNEELLTLSN